MQIAGLLGNHRNTVRSNLEGAPEGSGRSSKVTDTVWARLQKALDELVAKANAQREVTVAMVIRRARVQACERTVRDAFHARGIRFRKLREKPILTEQDVKDRRSFAKTHVGKLNSYWAGSSRQCVHMFLDNKYFPVYTNGKTRGHAARRTVRGTYRTKGKGLKRGHVKERKDQKFNTGQRGVQIACGIGAGKVLMWHEVRGNWGAAEAVRMYKEGVLPALRAGFPKKGPRSRWTILEDNDPAGYKTKKAVAAKAEAKIDVLEFPKRSPDLNPLDFSIWAEVNRRMRAAEKRWRPSTVETRPGYLRRLRRTALGLPAAYINKVCQNMTKRLAALEQGKGGLIEEGGRAR